MAITVVASNEHPDADAVTRPCFARETVTGTLSQSSAEAIVTGDFRGSGEGQVTDRYADLRYLAAEFVYRVNGNTLYRILIGAPDGGSVVISFPEVDGAYQVQVVSTAYYGIADSSASATAYWTEFCPLYEFSP